MMEKEYSFLARMKMILETCSAKYILEVALIIRKCEFHLENLMACKTLAINFYLRGILFGCIEDISMSVLKKYLAALDN